MKQNDCMNMKHGKMTSALDKVSHVHLHLHVIATDYAVQLA